MKNPLRNLALALTATLAFPAVHAAPSDLDTTLVHSSTLATGSGTGALVGFGLTAPFSALAGDGRFNLVVHGGCHTTQQVTGSVYLTLSAAGQFESVAGAPCSDGVVPGSIARTQAYNAVRLSNGKLMLQTDTEGLDIRLRLVRMNADGSIDTTFGTSGQLVANKSDGSAILSGVGLRDASRMIVDGQNRLYISANGSQIARVLADGTLDTTYGSSGYANSPLANGAIVEMAFDANGKLLVTGRRNEQIAIPNTTITVTAQRYWLARFNSDGSHDTTFRNDAGGADNIVRLQSLTDTSAPKLGGRPAPESNGNVLVTVDNELRRYDGSGNLLGSLAFAGEPDTASGRTLGITLTFSGIDGSGRIVVAGQGVNTSQQPTVRRIVVGRVNADLSRDTAFDSSDATPNGLRVHDLGSGRSYAGPRGSIHFGSNGKITLVGDVDGTGSEVAIVRLVGDGGGPSTDGTPDAFDFGVNENATANSVDVSPAVTISGIDVPVAISIDNSAQGRGYSIGCTGTFTATPGTIENGQTVCLRHDTGSPGTRIVTTLTVGGVTGSFESVVPAPVVDTEPDAYDFPASVNAEPGSVVESVSREIGGFNSATAISVSGGEYRIDGGAYTSTSGQLQPGQSVQLRVTAPATGGASATATVTIGGVSAGFTVTTRMPPQASTETIVGTSGTVELTTAGGTLENVRAVTTTPGAAPSGFSYPDGFFAFDVEDVTPGAEITVQITLPSASRPNAYVKCNADGTSCNEFAGASFSGNVVTLRLTDGGAGDADGLANGRIVDPGAPAVRATTRTDDDNGGALGAPLLVLFGLLAAWRSRRHALR
jgi:uncharacterized delta-60 repeat protein